MLPLLRVATRGPFRLGRAPFHLRVQVGVLTLVPIEERDDATLPKQTDLFFSFHPMYNRIGHYKL